MSPLSILCLLWTLAAAAERGRGGGVDCVGEGCRPRPATLQPATAVLAPTQAPLKPASTPPSPTSAPTTKAGNHTIRPKPTNHTTQPKPTSPKPTNHTTHPVPTNHTTHPVPTNHTTHPVPTNHTTHPVPTNHTTHPVPTNHTTHPVPTNHTTHLMPTTTRPANHTTRPPPTTPPSPVPKGTYTLRNKKALCAMATLRIQLRVQYMIGKKEKWGIFYIQPNKTKASGKCDDHSVNMTLTFPRGYITLRFRKNTKDNTFYLQQMQTQLVYQFPGTTKSTTYAAHNSGLALMTTHLNHSYQCSNVSVEAGIHFWVDLEDQQVQVFQFPATQTFGAVEKCPADKHVPVVAIVVAVLLILLIVIVVVAYLLGRRRSPAGYQSI